MKSVILRGVEVKIGDKVRYIDDRNIYTSNDITKPVVGKVYTISGFSVGSDGNPGFYLEEVKNYKFPFGVDGRIEWAIPGFAIWRFEPYTPLSMSEINTEAINKVFERLIEKTLVVFE